MFFPGTLEILSMGIMPLLFSGVGMPLNVRLGEEDPALLAIAPEDCLYYASWAEAGEADPASENAVDQWLAEPEVVMFMEQLRAHFLQWADSPHSDISFLEEEEFKILLSLLSHSGACYLEEFEPGDHGFDLDDLRVRGGLLLALGDDAESAQEIFEELQDTFLRSLRVESIQIEGHPFYEIIDSPEDPTFVWGVYENYLLAGFGPESITDMLGRLGNAPPAWLVEKRAEMGLEKIAIFSYANIEKLVEGTNAAYPTKEGEVNPLTLLGLDNVRDFSAVVGFQEGSYISRSHLGIEGKPEGLLQLLAGEPLPPESLARIPGDSDIAMALSIDPSEIFNAFVELLPASARREMEQGMAMMERDTGINFVSDFVEPLGNNAVIYASPSEGGGILTGLTGIIALDDVEQFRATQDRLWGFIEANQNPSNRWDPYFRKTTFHDHDIYYMSTMNEFPWSPCWTISDDVLIVSAFPQNIRAYLTRDESFASLLDNEEVVRAFEGTPPFALSHLDSEPIYRMMYPWSQIALQALGEFDRLFGGEGSFPGPIILPSAPSILPHLEESVRTWTYQEDGFWTESRKLMPGIDMTCYLPMAAATAIPASIPLRMEIERSHKRNLTRNNMRQISLALLNYETQEGGFPTAYSVDAEGNPLLSWRVHMLPYLEEQELYDEFHLDEPWDSAHNLALVERMPAVFQSGETYQDPLGAGKTTFLALINEASIFEEPINPDNPSRVQRGARFADIIDGTYRTVMFVEVNQSYAAEWTRPVDYDYSEEDPAAWLGTTSNPDTFMAAFADGHSQKLSTHAPGNMLHALFRRNDGINLDPWELSPYNYDEATGEWYGRDLDLEEGEGEAEEFFEDAFEDKLRDLEEELEGGIQRDAVPAIERPIEIE